MVVQQLFQKMMKQTVIILLFMAFHGTFSQIQNKTCPDKCLCKNGDVNCRAVGFRTTNSSTERTNSTNITTLINQLSKQIQQAQEQIQHNLDVIAKFNNQSSEQSFERNLKNDSKRQIKTWIIIVAVVASVVLLASVITITTRCYLCHKRGDSKHGDGVMTEEVPSGRHGINNSGFQAEGTVNVNIMSPVNAPVYEEAASPKGQMRIYEEIENNLSEISYDGVNLNTNPTAPPLVPPLREPAHDVVSFNEIQNNTIDVSEKKDLYEQPNFNKDKEPLPVRQQSVCQQSSPDDLYDNKLILEQSEQHRKITEPEYCYLEGDYTNLPDTAGYTMATYQALAVNNY